ncbi:hypothetical protein [Rhizobium leguminosarum]|uniref:hypothetical protein n=1 Tax=Rhizobium leguminosarum TaxID=384 RepID=UPI001030125C|nr:hypothetical protein [Rhizobium leguminosarum]TAX33466.1 hypothetical protein ELI06_03640 [Rhizobium leguminosarum]TAY71245.1 hypothetical protein ELH83_35395 [Rhizobium leguminosarum]
MSRQFAGERRFAWIGHRPRQDADEDERRRRARYEHLIQAWLTSDASAAKVGGGYWIGNSEGVA